MRSQAEFPVMSDTTSEAGAFWPEVPDHGRAMARMGAFTTRSCKIGALRVLPNSLKRCAGQKAAERDGCPWQA